MISWNYRTVVTLVSVTYKKDTSYKWLIISRNFIELNEKIIRTFHYFIVSKCDKMWLKFELNEEFKEKQNESGAGAVEQSNQHKH